MLNKDYLLKHRDTDVALFNIDPVSRHISSVQILDTVFSPVNTKSSNIAKGVALHDWLSHRCISNSREGIERLKTRYHINDVRDLMLAQKGLSLSDHYWIDSYPFKHKWKKVNLFENGYSEEIGKLLFDTRLRIVDGDTLYKGNSPELTTGGRLSKYWKRNTKDGKDYLVKGGSGMYRQEPFNEYYAHLVLKALKYDHTPYHVRKGVDGQWVSMCPCIANIDKEMVSAHDIRRKYGIDKNYHGLIGLMHKKACGHMQDAIDKMIIIDYIIANTDRHWDNFGIVRNGVTGAWLEVTPLFDNGYSLWNGDQVNASVPIRNESFADYNEECLAMVDIQKHIKKIPDLPSLFDQAFSRFEHKDRKLILRKGVESQYATLNQIMERGIHTVIGRQYHNNNKKSARKC